jgi:hypothetical protein
MYKNWVEAPNVATVDYIAPDTDGNILLKQTLTKEEYDQITPDIDVVYYINDTNEVYLNGTPYGSTVKVNPTGMILSDENELTANVSMAYDSDTGNLTLFGKVDESSEEGDRFILSQVNIPLDQFESLDSAEIVTNPDGQPAGTYLALTFLTSTGDKVVYINVEALAELLLNQQFTHI